MKITNNLTALYFLAIAKAITKKICLASYLFSLFLARNQFLELPLIMGNHSEAKLLRIFIGESDKLKNIPLYEALVFEAKKEGLSALP